MKESMADRVSTADSCKQEQKSRQLLAASWQAKSQESDPKLAHINGMRKSVTQTLQQSTWLVQGHDAPCRGHEHLRWRIERSQDHHLQGKNHQAPNLATGKIQWQHRSHSWCLSHAACQHH